MPKNEKMIWISAVAFIQGCCVSVGRYYFAPLTLKQQLATFEQSFIV